MLRAEICLKAVAISEAGRKREAQNLMYNSIIAPPLSVLDATITIDTNNLTKICNTFYCNN